MRSSAGADAPFPPRPRGAAVERSIAVEAPIERVWQVLADVAGWGAWNPIYPEAAGRLAEGERIALTIALPGATPRRSTATVFHAVPNRSVQFGAAALGGLLLATRYIELRPDGAGCIVVNGESFSRLLAGPLVRRIGDTIGEGLMRQNEGLKRAAERR